MAIIDFQGEKRTPHQAAKEILLDSMSRASYWPEGVILEHDKMTPGEIKKVNEAIQKHFDRVQKFLGYGGYALG